MSAAPKRKARSPIAASASATYVYGILRSPKSEPTLAATKRSRTPRGLEGTTNLRVLDAGGGYYVVAATAPLALYDAPVIDARLRDLDWVGARAAEHEAVVEFSMTLGTVVPMKLFTMFATDERATANVEKMKRSLDRVVERIDGCEEWGLRILFDEARAARAHAEEARATKPSSGRDFLLKKKVLVEERRSASARGVAEIDELYRKLSKTCRSAKRRAAPNRELAGRVMLDAVFLVPRAKVKALHAAVTASAERLALEGFDISLTGPWPTYSFIGAE